MSIAEVMGNVSSASIILHVENSQNETKVLELEQNSSNVEENIRLDIKDKIKMSPNQVSNTKLGSDVSITIEKEEGHEESQDIINEIINIVIQNLDLSTIDWNFEVYPVFVFL